MAMPGATRAETILEVRMKNSPLIGASWGWSVPLAALILQPPRASHKVLGESLRGT
jgi:hypothetical protein